MSKDMLPNCLLTVMKRFTLKEYTVKLRYALEATLRFTRVTFPLKRNKNGY